VSKANDKPIVLTWEQTGRGRPVVKATRSGDVLLVERMDLADSKQRARFARRLYQEAKVAPAQTERQLMQFASEWSESQNAKPEPEPPPADGQELDAREIVRPERFITSEVSGLSVPVMVPAGEGVVGQWRVYLRWADGRRERRILKATLETGGGRLWFYLPPLPR